MYSSRITAGFTLSEVLVTLAIIGVVAALIIPGIVQNVQKKQYVSGLNKAYSDLSQATMQVMDDNGGKMTYVFPSNSYADRNRFRDKFCQTLNCIKRCDAGSPPSDCSYSTYKALNGTILTDTANYLPRAILSNGMLIYFDYLPSCSTYSRSNNNFTMCGAFRIDINGFKEPNQVGRDIFYFEIAQNGVFPQGSKSAATSANWNTYCNPSSSDTSGWNMCAGRVLIEGIMNY